MSESDITEEEQRNAIITTITLDISSKHLKEVPKTIKNFSNIEFLYLCTNDIKSIPDHFFTSLPQLKWLDFRHNLLTALPTSIGEHRQLRTLLLQGNQLATLPVELGNVPTLTGLNIADNPIEYPPKTVLQEGTQEILKYLRLELQSESLLIPELIDALEEVHITENEGYLGSGEEARVLGPIKRMSRRKNRTEQEIQSPLSNRFLRKELNELSVIWHRNNEVLSQLNQNSRLMNLRPSTCPSEISELSACLVTERTLISRKSNRSDKGLDGLETSSTFITENWDNEEHKEPGSERLRFTTPRIGAQQEDPAISATLLPRERETRWSASDTLITSKPKMPKRRKKFRSANPIERVRRSDHYIQKAIQDYEEKRMQAIRKEENSRTEMMVQRMRDRDALKMWRQQSIRQIESRKSGIVSSRSSERSGEKKLKLKRLEKTATSKTNLEHIIGYITTQIEALKLREQRLCYEINNANGPELKKLRRIIERKQIELLEMRKKRTKDDNSQFLPMKRNHTLASIKPIKQKSVSMTNKELELRNKIKEHAVRLKEYHNSEKKKRSEAQLNLDQAQDIHDEMRQLNTEYRFRAFTGETAE